METKLLNYMSSVHNGNYITVGTAISVGGNTTATLITEHSFIFIHNFMTLSH